MPQKVIVAGYMATCLNSELLNTLGSQYSAEVQRPFSNVHRVFAYLVVYFWQLAVVATFNRFALSRLLGARYLKSAPATAERFPALCNLHTWMRTHSCCQARTTLMIQGCPGLFFACA